jgi:CBS domain-containing protein
MVKKFEGGVIKGAHHRLAADQHPRSPRDHACEFDLGCALVEGEALVGSVTRRDLRFETKLDQLVVRFRAATRLWVKQA